VKGTNPRLTSSRAMLVCLRRCESTSILGCEPRTSCLALKAVTTISLYLESIPGHSSSFEMWLKPLCVVWSVLDINDSGLPDSFVLKDLRRRACVIKSRSSVGSLKVIEQVKDCGQSESGNDDDVQPAHRRAMAVRAFNLPEPHLRSAFMAIPDHLRNPSSLTAMHALAVSRTGQSRAAFYIFLCGPMRQA
jgi:hypothetical protein